MNGQTTGSRFKPWPDEFEAEYLTLVHESRRLARAAQVAIDHGVKNYRNVPLLERLLPIMTGQARLILNAQQRMLRAKTGRWPNWVLEAIESGLLLAHDMVGAAEGAERALKRQRWHIMTTGLQTCIEAAQAIEIYVTRGPMPESLDPLALLDRITEEA